ncbi:MAG: radical SAM protein [Candidatus Omnitrophota bacterium]|nr:radical SAM protein [Candidatus Omnitrophota bacterium]
MINCINKISNGYLDVIGILNGKRAFCGPDTIQIDLTDYCNNQCLACWCNSPLLSKERLDRRKDMLPAGLVKKLIAETAEMGLREIYFSGGGEPFMHPDILKIISHAKEFGIACAINTNFTLISREIIQRLIELKVDSITVSVWAGTADIYKDLHPGKKEEDFFRIQDALSYLNSQKKDRPLVKVYNVICNINYQQIAKMLDFAAKTNSEFVEFTLVDTIPGATDKIILSVNEREFLLKQFKEIPEGFLDPRINHKPKILNLQHFLRRLSNPDAQCAEYDTQFIDSLPCYVGWLFARIMPNGDVNSCLKSHRFPVGNLHKQSFKKIWNSQKQIYFRKKTLATRKDDEFFSLIGNDPNCKTGCYKSCDDINRNVSIHNKIMALPVSKRRILSLMGKTGFAGLMAKFKM